MSTLVLVRHGQAKPFTRSPDQLSQLGWEQARLLGRHWVERGVRFDAAYHGTLRRQRESCEAVAAAFRAVKLPFPEPRELDGLNEYQALDQIASIGPGLADRDAGFAPLWEAWQSATSDRSRSFQLMLESFVNRWFDDRLEAPGLEPWQDFRCRVSETLREIRDRHVGGQRVVAFTSAGPIGVAVQECLGARVAAALELHWRIRNTSLTSLVYSVPRISLDAFNELPHLSRSADLITFR